MARRMGAGTIRLERASAIAAVAAVGSRLEQEGPLSAEFDRTVEDSSFGEKSWEKAETKMQQLAWNWRCKRGGQPRDRWMWCWEEISSTSA